MCLYFSSSSNDLQKSKIIPLVITILIPNCSLYTDVGAGVRKHSQVTFCFQHVLFNIAFPSSYKPGGGKDKSFSYSNCCYMDKLV